ncbi:MAG TPA: protease [Flavobacteriales bacterium]|jgi:heat shock protein HtpX|nr:M48 family metallopeptidase [Salibacteraceae bacterium]HAW20545.1 protease [Flavobacteriales bacterium]
MKYIGLQAQIRRNNTKSMLLLLMFPTVLIVLVVAFFHILNFMSEEPISFGVVNDEALLYTPFVLVAVAIWFTIAWFGHTAMIQRATSAKPLERKENLRVYNLLENLCISRGLDIPKLYIIPDESLNAFASGLTKKTYAISLSEGIINMLNDDELETVIAHELTHIRNRDVRLLVVSIIFVGIFAFVAEIGLRSLYFSGRGKKNNSGIIVVVIALAGIGWLLSMLFRFSISRKREYLADAGAVELTKKPLALASALEKISRDPLIEAVKREDVAQMFIEHPSEKKKGFSLSSIFATHPPIEKRIEVLRQF